MNKCSDCSKCLRLEKWDYSVANVPKTPLEGYACLVFAHEGLVVNIVGCDPESEGCEEWSERKHQ